ncbi:hepatitis A virus cellular receptor 1 homolog isoform X1 [Parambassis ranga]|uniref:Hepatitis A virus cellular receptor 1 homolog isoform X1 n=1 Tax=Parambassis ranga TaxID=210632 RepID=A0A6P7JLF3_9TELE|nr:hepatitis A virus cellular receptor 1 homolog isoform X1 [Parambassis ranga]
MLPPLLDAAAAAVCVLSALSCVSAVTTDTVVGVAGRAVMLPCRTEAVKHRGVAVCWGRGEPSLFSCRNTVTDSAGGVASYRKSHRYSVSSSSSLFIQGVQSSDSGFYHCRAQLPGLFNDQTSSVHLIIIEPRSRTSGEGSKDRGTPNAPPATTSECSSERQSGRLQGLNMRSDVTGDNSTEPMLALVQSSLQQHVNTLQVFVGNTVRLSFIIFIPALLLTAAYRVWRSKQRSVTDRRLGQSEDSSSV